MSTSTKLSAKERIFQLLDEHSFVEIGAFVHARSTDFNMAEVETPADGVITGYGRIEDNLVYVYSQDVSVMGGAVGEMHAKKIAAIYDLALKTGAPVIGLADSAGMRLQEATDALNAFGELFYRQTLASGVIPQITAVFGSCGGGMALVPALTDFTFMAKEGGKLFVNSPNALDGNRIEKCDTSSADYQGSIAGTVDYTGATEAEVLEKIRELVSILPANNEDEGFEQLCEDDLNRENQALSQTLDTHYMIEDIADNRSIFEIKADYAKEMVTAFIQLNGKTVGAVANRSEVLGDDGSAEMTDPVLTTAGAAKAEKFIRFCDAFSIPVLTLVNVKGFKATMDEELSIGKAAAKLTSAYAESTVPKVTLIAGDAYGSAYLTMGSRHIGTDVVYAYPKAKIGMMSANSAVKIIYADEIDKAEDKTAFIREKTNAYDTLQTSPLSAASRGYVDDIIEPAATRKRLIAAFDMLLTKREGRPSKKHGTV